jgi:hypothetical protein
VNWLTIVYSVYYSHIFLLININVWDLFWSIWHHRNDVIWNDNPSLPNQIKHDENYNLPPPNIDRWEKPRFGWIKCNVDAAFFCDVGVTTIEACFRDHVGNFMVGFMQRQQSTMSTMEGEAWALLHAMKEAIHRGLDMV